MVQAPTPSPPVVLEIIENDPKKTRWTVLLHPQSLLFVRAGDAQSFEITRQDRPEKTVLHDGLLLRRMVSAKLDKNRLFRLEPSAWKAFREWIGPPTLEDLRVSLKGRLAWSVPIGILFILTSLPLAGDPARGLEPLPLDGIGMILGGSLVVSALLSRIAPHRALFLVDSLFFAAMAAYTTVGVLSGASGWGWAIVLFFQVKLLREGFSEYRRFTPELIAASSAEGGSPS